MSFFIIIPIVQKNLFAFPTPPASDRTKSFTNSFALLSRLFEYRNLSVSNLKENVKITVILVVPDVSVR